MPGNAEHAVPAPLAAIRRFDVFAEYTRQDRLAKGDPADVARGYGIWLAKVVAARRFGKKEEGLDRPPSDRDRGKPESKFRSLGDEPQTDKTFEHDIVDRMGREFYDEVFVPAITAARERGERYEEIRDRICKGWKPSR